MAIQTTPAWSGTDGQVPNTANAGISFPVTSDGGTIVFDDAWQPNGFNSLLSTGTTTSGANYVTHLVPTTDALAYRVPVMPRVRASTWREPFFMALAGSTQQTSMLIGNAGEFMIAVSSGTVAYTSAAGVMATASPCIASIFYTRHPTAGTLRAALYEMDGTTLRLDTGLLTGLNTGSVKTDSVRIGAKAGTSNRATTVSVGRPEWDSAATGLLPIPTPPEEWRHARQWVDGEYIGVDLFYWDDNANIYRAI